MHYEPLRLASSRDARRKVTRFLCARRQRSTIVETRAQRARRAPTGPQQGNMNQGQAAPPAQPAAPPAQPAVAAVPPVLPAPPAPLPVPQLRQPSPWDRDGRTQSSTLTIPIPAPRLPSYTTKP